MREGKRERECGWRAEVHKLVPRDGFALFLRDSPSKRARSLGARRQRARGRKRRARPGAAMGARERARPNDVFRCDFG